MDSSEEAPAKKPYKHLSTIAQCPELHARCFMGKVMAMVICLSLCIAMQHEMTSGMASYQAMTDSSSSDNGSCKPGESLKYGKGSAVLRTLAPAFKLKWRVAQGILLMQEYFPKEKHWAFLFPICSAVS